MSKKTGPNLEQAPMELTQAEKEALWLEAEAEVADELKAAERSHERIAAGGHLPIVFKIGGGGGFRDQVLIQG